jgi:DNA modification methylase
MKSERQYAGYEIDGKYLELAKRRINKEFEA